MSIYNAATGLPSTFRRPVGDIPLVTTRHAREQADKRSITLPNRINFGGKHIFEVEMQDNGRVEKIGVRFSYDAKNDLCLIVRNVRGRWILLTAYINEKTDQHKTLRTENYSVLTH